MLYCRANYSTIKQSKRRRPAKCRMTVKIETAKTFRRMNSQMRIARWRRWSRRGDSKVFGWNPFLSNCVLKHFYNQWQINKKWFGRVRLYNDFTLDARLSCDRRLKSPKVVKNRPNLRYLSTKTDKIFLFSGC